MKPRLAFRNHLDNALSSNHAKNTQSDSGPQSWSWLCCQSAHQGIPARSLLVPESECPCLSVEGDKTSPLQVKSKSNWLRKDKMCVCLCAHASTGEVGGFILPPGTRMSRSPNGSRYSFNYDKDLVSSHSLAQPFSTVSLSDSNLEQDGC